MTNDQTPVVDATASPAAFESARLELARLDVSHGVTTRTLFNQLGALVVARLAIARFGIWLHTEDGRSLRCHRLYQSSQPDCYEGACLHALDFPRYFAALQTNRVIPIHDTVRDPLADEMRVPYLEPLSISSLLDAPIYRGGKVIGVVCHEHSGPPRVWTPAECDFAISVAETVARLFEAAARQLAETSLIAYKDHVLRMNRMEALGHLAAGVAHDFRNILAVIMGTAEIIRETPDVPAEASAAAESLLRAADTGYRLTRELLTFGKDTPDAPVVTAPQQVVADILDVLRAAVGPGIAIDVQAQPDVSRIFVDTSQLERALVNLALNGRDAMPEGGTLTLCITEARLPEDDDGGIMYVRLSLSDTGAGMDAQTVERIFDPFFTTKGDKGTGLGMAIVYQIISRAGGFLRVESEVGHGSTIHLYLPRIAHHSASTQHPPTASPVCT